MESKIEQVSNRLRTLDEAKRLAERLSQTMAAELREARLAAGLTQAAVARALGTSRSRVTRVELARVRRLSLEYLARHAATVGLKLSVKLYPASGRLRDQVQVRYIARFLERIGHAWRVRLDVPMPLQGDLRAIDITLDGACLIAVEVISRLRDLQAQLRAAQLKQRDLGATRLIIVVVGSAANRRALNEARSTLLASFDLDTRRTLASLRAGEDPGRDAIVVLD